MDAQEAPLPGVTIKVKGEANGAVTDANGKFKIEAETEDILVFSFVGFTTKEVAINGRSSMDVVLEENLQQLEEVVVVGYGVQRKSHLTGSVSRVVNDQLDQIPLGRIDDALVGQVAGVNIQMTNPAAGEAPVIRVRGQGSISFDSNPLIVVDGIAVGTDADFLASLDMNDIESMEVLKDASAAAIYGSRGANGIVMITTKQGVEGPTRISYNGYVGFKSVPSNDYLTTPENWIAFAQANDPDGLSEKLQYVQRLGTYTNWEEVMFDGGMIHSNSLAVRGGTANTKYRASVNYMNDEGVLLTDNYEKLNLRLNLDTKVNETIEFGIVLNPSYTEQRRFPIGVHDALRGAPWLPLYLDEDNIQFVNRERENGRWADAQVGDYAMERMFDDYDLEQGIPLASGGTDISTTSNASPLAKVLERDRRRYQTKIFGNAYLKLNLADGLFFKQSFGGDVRYTRNTTWIGVNATRNGARDSEARLATGLRNHLVTESTLNYNKQLGDHYISAVGGFAFESWFNESSTLEAAGFENDLIRVVPAANLVGGNTSASREALISYLARINYVYNEKYLLSLSARTDGSSKFGPDNKYGFFPAVSAGWNISEEGFLANSEIITELKVRASYGITGSNSGIGEYDHIGLLSPVGTAIGVNGFNPINIANTQLRWEKLEEFNPGIDIALFRGRLGISLDYYERTSNDLLLNLPIPSVTGFGEALVNRGVVENKGFEAEIITRNTLGPNLNWTTSIILTHNRNTLVDFAGSDGLISVVDPKRAAEWIALEGSPISSFYGYVVSDEIAPEYIKDAFYPINGQSQDVYVRDLNGDGLIDPDDRTVLGSPYPDLIWSVNNTFKFKGFDAAFMFQGSHGAEVRNISSQYILNEFAGNMDFSDEFPDADLVTQRIFTNDDIQDASYVALRNINVGYRFNSVLLDEAGVRNARFFVAAQNLLYIMAEGYQGYNPEGIDQGLGNPLTYGYQRGPAPIYRTFSLGVNLEF